MLTHNKMPWPRYQDSNIKVSFLDFEASIPNIDKRRLPSLQILLSVLMDQVKPIGLRAKTGEYFNLPHTYIASTNEFLRSVATHSASIALGQSKDSPNFSDAFMMLAGWQKNPKFLNVLEPRAELDQSSKLKLWLSPDYYSSFQIGIQVEKNRVFDLYQKEILVYSFQSLQKNKSLKYLNQNFVERILQESFPLISSEELERKLNDANQWKSQSLDLKKSFQSLELIINIVLDLEKLREEIMEGNSSYTMHDFETQILYGRLNYIKYLMKNDILLAHMFHSLQWSEQLPSARLIRMNTDPMAYWSMLYNHLLQMYRNFKEQRPEL